jgi:DNA-binding protein HU-beta
LINLTVAFFWLYCYNENIKRSKPYKINFNKIIMTKEGLTDVIVSRINCSKKDAGEALEALTDAITKSLTKGEDVTITGFGTFSARKRAARQGVNPKTGEKISIPAMTVAKFKAGKGLKEAVR